jgi:hypothetical protein
VDTVSNEGPSDCIDKDAALSSDAGTSPPATNENASSSDESADESANPGDKSVDKQDEEKTATCRAPRTNRHSAYGQWQQVVNERSVEQIIYQVYKGQY